MFKFLRKYNKWILAVGGTLLLIVFLIPQAVTGLSQQAAVSSATRATIGEGDEEVPVSELQAVLQEMQYMQQIGMTIPGLGELDNPWHWYLLVREAEEAGLVGGSLGSIDPSALRGSGTSARTVEGVITKVTGVARLIQLYHTAGHFSDHRLRSEAQRLFHTVQVQSVVIPASPELAGYEPSETEIEAQMKQYADLSPDDPKNRFAYKLPDRVRLEWLAVPAQSVRTMLEKSDLLSGTALRTHWHKKVTVDPSFPKIPDVPPASVPDIVRNDLLDTLTREKLDEIARFGTSQLRSRTHALPRQDGYVVLPPDWAGRRLSFQELGGLVAERFAIETPVPEDTGGRWLGLSDLAALEGIGKSDTDKFPPGRKTLTALVAMARELKGSTTLQVQSGIAGPPLAGPDGTVYFFRILEVDASRPPKSVDEVREQVVKDLKRLKNYDALVARVPAIQQQAIDEGLIGVAMANDTVLERQRGVSLYDQGTILRQTALRMPLEPEPSALPKVGVHRPTVEAIIARAEELPEDLSTATETQRILALPVDEKLSVIVVRIVEQRPFTERDFQARALTNQIQEILLTQETEGSESLDKVFGYEALAKRHNLKVLSEDGESPAVAVPPRADVVADAFAE